MKSTAQESLKATPAPSALRSRTLRRKCACGQHAPGGGECTACREKKAGLRRAASGAASPGVAPPIVHEVLRAPGQPLDREARAFMEPRFGHDFSRVRVHTDDRAAASARAVDALAYTVGSDLVFEAGRYAPSTPQGRRLLAHELAHAVKEPGAPAHPAPKPGTLSIEDPDALSERVAEAAAERVMDNRMTGPLPAAPVEPAVGLHRQPAADVTTPAADTAPAAATPAPSACQDARGSGHPAGTSLSFGQDASATTSAHEATIAALARAWVAQGGTVPVEVHGFASLDGPDGYNFALSCRRAEAVKQRLAADGITGTITTFAHGETDEFGGALSANRRAIVTMADRPEPVAEPRKAPALLDIFTLHPGTVPPGGPADFPGVQVTSGAEQQVTPSPGGSESLFSKIEVNAEVESQVIIFSRGDRPDPAKPDPCRRGKVETHVQGKLKLEGLGIGEHVNLFYHEPTLTLNLPTPGCQDLPEIKAEVDFLNVEVFPKVLELSLKPALTIGDGQLKPGGSAEVEIKPWGKRTDVLGDISIKGAIEVTSEKAGDSSERTLKTEGTVGVSVEF